MQTTRRSWIKNNLAMAAAAGAASSLSIPNAHATRLGRIKMSHHVNFGNPTDIKLCLQMGVRHAVTSGTIFRNISPDQYDAAVKKDKEDWTAAGMILSVYENLTPVPADNIKRGTPGRDKELANWIAVIQAMGKNGIPLLCYNLGAGGRRTSNEPIARGGATTSIFDYEASKKEALFPPEDRLTDDQLWANLTWFLERIIPECEKAKVKMGYHPNDPPVSPYRGTSQIMISPAAYRRLLNIAPSPYNCISFCQSNFRAMKYAPGEDLYSVAKEFTETGRVAFVHFRDIEGSADTRFVEKFHDEGPTDMPQMLQIYSRAGFNGYLRTDHAPAMEGEKPGGYGTLGHVFAIGYVIGIMQTANIAYE